MGDAVLDLRGEGGEIVATTGVELDEVDPMIGVEECDECNVDVGIVELDVTDVWDDVNRITGVDLHWENSVNGVDSTDEYEEVVRMIELELDDVALVRGDEVVALTLKGLGEVMLDLTDK